MSAIVEEMRAAAQTNGPLRARSVRIWRSIPMATAAVVISALFVSSAAAAPLVFSPLITQAAPFKGTLHLAQTLSSAGCGAASSFPVKPKFNLNTGIGRVEERASAKGCGLPGFSDDALAYAVAGFDSRTIPLAGVTSDILAFNYSDNYTYNLSASPRSPAGGPFAWAAMQIEFVAILWNLTTMQPWGGISVHQSDTTNYSTTGYENRTLGGPVGFWTHPIVPNPSYQYVVMIYFVATVWVHAPAGTSLHASAKLDMGTGAHNFTAINWAWH